MKTKTIRTLYKIGIFLAVAVFAAMLWDHFQNDAELVQVLAIVGAAIVLWLFIMLFITPYDVDVRVERVQVTDVVQVEETGVPQDDGMDYPGDVHEVVDLEGIGPKYAEKLQAMGINNTQELLFADPRDVAAQTGAGPKTVDNWRAMAQLIKVRGVGPQYAEALVRAGIDGLEEMRDEPAAAIAGAVTGYLSSIDQDVVGQKVTTKRVQAWQKAARKMKREVIDVTKVKVRRLESKAAKSDA